MSGPHQEQLADFLTSRWKHEGNLKSYCIVAILGYTLTICKTQASLEGDTVDTVEWPTGAELRVMRVLQEHPQGLYGLEIVEHSGKRKAEQVTRGSVYVLLMRLDEKGFLEIDRSKGGSYPGLPRPHYRLNALGQRVLAAEEMKRAMMLPGGA